MFFQVESNHDRVADTFDFLRFRVNHPLNEMKAFSPNFRNGGLYSDMIRCENLLYKVGFDMNNDYADLFPVHSRTYGSKVFSDEIRFLPLFSLNLFYFDAKVVLLRVILNRNSSRNDRRY
mgnify:CR=1 FL=1